MTTGAAAASHASGEGHRPIAVVTVCRNPGAQLAGALDSVAALRDARVRHIVVDGASTDGTAEHLARAGHALHRWISEPDRGIYDAMNKGWVAAPANAWLLFLGADDRLLRVPPADEMREHEASGCALVYGSTEIAGGQTFPSRYGPELRLHNTLHHQSLLVRKDAHPEPPFDATLRVYGDWEFNLRLWRAGATARHSPTLRAQASPGGISALPPIGETWRIASRHSALPVALTAAAMAAASRLRIAVRGHRESRHARVPSAVRKAGGSA